MRTLSREGKMKNGFERLNIHQKMEILIEEMVDKELPLNEAIKEFKKIYIETMSSRCNGNKTKMALALGIHRNTLNNIIRTLKIK
jgi:DNA-binding NtrC family response regulator